MWKVVCGGVLAMSLLACGGPPYEEPVEEHINETPPDVATQKADLYRYPACIPVCFGSCGPPDLEPLGQICWLTNSVCMCGASGSPVLTCYYHCEPVEPELQRY